MTMNLPENQPLSCPDSHSLLGACSTLIACFTASGIAISANLLLQMQESKICKVRGHQQKLRTIQKQNIGDIIRMLCSSGQCHRRIMEWFGLEGTL